MKTAKEYLEEKYQEKKQHWSNSPIDSKWKKFAAEVMEDFANAQSKALLENLELYKNATNENPNQEYQDWQYDKDVDFILSLIPKEQ